MPKIKLDFKQEPTEYYEVIGIVSNAKIWKLCWELNKLLGIELALDEQGEHEPFRESTREVYSDKEHHSLFEIHLLPNFMKVTKSLKGVNEIQFLLVLKPKTTKTDISGLVQKIRKVDIIDFAVEFTDYINTKELML